MRDTWRQILRFIRSLFGDNVPQSGGYVSLPLAQLSPRERMLRRCSRLLLAGALLNGLAGLLLLAIALRAGTVDSQLFASLQGAMLPGGGISADASALLLVAGSYANMALLLVLAVVILAQELWTVGIAWLGIAANGAALLAWGYAPGLLAALPLLAVGMLTLRDLRAFRLNPVMVKELRGRMRGLRGFTVITVFLTLMSLFTLLLYMLQMPAGGAVVTGELGRQLFIGLLFIELLLILCIVPALTAGAISSERERKTYDLLQSTLISKATLVVGKYQSALGYILLLLLSAIPLQGLAFFFGGISEQELLLAQLILLMSALTLGAFGMYFSSFTERSLSATVRAYTVVLGITVGIPLVAQLLFRGAFGAVVNNVAGSIGGSPSAEAAVIYLDMIATSLNPILATLRSQQMLIDHQQLLTMRVTLSSNGATIPVLSPWLLLSVSYLALSAVLVGMAIRRMERQGG